MIHKHVYVLYRLCEHFLEHGHTHHGKLGRGGGVAGHVTTLWGTVRSYDTGTCIRYWVLLSL